MLPPVGLASWMAATAGHFVLTAWWVRRLDPSPLARLSRDERWFQSTLSGVGGLALVIHLLTLTVGLSLAAGIAALAVYHALLVLVVAMRGRSTSGLAADLSPAPAHGEAESRVERVLEICAAAVLTGIGLAWIFDASSSMLVTGTDATHYHVPVAANLALGGHLFDLPATQHLYPMASSALAAWFIVPLGGPLLVDLTMLLPFLLLAASAAWIFRLATGRSGLAWTPWLLLVLFSLRLFRSSSQMSADLMFAAACLALTAQLVAMIGVSRTRAIDFLLLGFAGGLLIGSKTTGIAAAGLAVVTAASAYPIVGFLLGERRQSIGIWHAVAGLTVAVVVAIGAGGVWLVRNWWLFGSPIAPTGVSLFGIEIFAGVPHEPTTYLSVLGDFQDDPAYPLGERLAHYAARWLGPWYLALLLPALLVPIDVMMARLRGQPDSAWRLLVWVFVIVTGAALGSLLIGAPWTSLERTGGFSLRYMLPFVALLPCLALIGLFPSSLPWYRHPPAEAAAGVAVGSAGLAALWLAQGGGFAAPRLQPWLLAAGAIPWLITSVLARRRPQWLQGSSALMACMIAVLGGSVAWAMDTETRGGRAHAAETRRLARANRQPEPARAAYLAALEWEEKQSRGCSSRRFFSITRLDRPLQLQSADYRNRVFYAGRDVAVTARAEPLTPCDYILASRGQLTSEKGQALIDALNRNGRTVEIAERAQFVVLGKE